MNPPTIRPDPLAHPRAIKIPLSEDQTECLAEHGNVFVVIGKASYPGNPKRMQLLCLPVDIATARDAESVALGRCKATKIRASKPTENDAISPQNDPEKP